MDGNAKSDLEHAAERTVAVSTKSSKFFTILFSKLLIRANRYYQKHFSSSMKALRNDGSTKELCVSPALTRAEVKQIITACRENNILMGIKKMHPDGELSNNKSLYEQEKIAHNEIKYKQWDERRKSTSKIKILNKYCKYRADKYKQLSIQDEQKNSEENYVIIFNKSRMGFFNEQLAKIPPNRIKQNTKNDIEDINKDGIIDERDIEPMLSRGMNLTVADLTRIGEDFGSCPVRDYQKNYCIQKITKEEYCEIREQLFELPSHGACVLNETEMIIAVRSEDLDEYMEYAPDKPIKEYGASGGREIESESNSNDIIELEIEDFKKYKQFKETYSSKDYVAKYNPSGNIIILAKETDTKQLVEDNKKKSKTADLVNEANEFVEQNKNIQVPESNILEQEKELEIDN